MLLDPAIDLLFRSAFFALFASSLAHKVANFTEFQGTTAAYFRGMLSPGTAIFAISLMVIVGEAIAAAVCIAPVDRALRAGAIAGILLLYAVAMGVNLLRGNTLLDCGCNWGKLLQPVTYVLVWRNLLLSLVALLLALPEGQRPMLALDAATVAAGTVLAALLYAGVNHSLANAARDYGRSK